tara:strand:+ start:220 stop:426 length:207 start_codon:yes stop_codon:yes gene_type:complete
MGTWSSGLGKFLKKDPNHGWLGKKIRNWLCDVGLCNLDKCSNKEHHSNNLPSNCSHGKCRCRSKKGEK